MNCTTCSRRLHDFVDGTLSAEEARACESHLSHCVECQRELEPLRRLRNMTATLPREIAPQRDLWNAISEQLSDARRSTAGNAPVRFSSSVPGWLAPLAMAASITFVSMFAEKMIPRRDSAGWSVAALSGTPRVDTRDVRDETKMHLGEWLVTDADARAKVVVGAIGEVSLEPNSRLRLVGMAAADHRVELARGTLSAMIWAPPRLFFVNTPSATAVDLGCAYTLTVDDDGNGELHVTTGFVSLVDRGREAVIRTGMMCLTRRGIGPGTPFAVDAPASLRAALTRFDFERAGTQSALADVLAHARPADAITLWHLLDRTQGASRAQVFDALASFSPPPAAVTRDGILRGDVAMRKAWGAELGIDRF